VDCDRPRRLLHGAEEAFSQSNSDDGFDLDVKRRSILTERGAIIACLVAGLMAYFGTSAPSAGMHALMMGGKPVSPGLDKRAPRSGHQ
jgi:hypothetical protein